MCNIEKQYLHIAFQSLIYMYSHLLVNKDMHSMKGSMGEPLVWSLQQTTNNIVRILSVQYMCIPAVLLSVSMLILMMTCMGHSGLMLYLVN